MNLEICCQCNEPTGRAGKGDDSLYTDCNWGPYCPDCWSDPEYWRCLVDERVADNELLRGAIAAALAVLPARKNPTNDLQRLVNLAARMLRLEDAATSPRSDDE